MALIKNIKHRSGRPVNGNYRFVEAKTDVNRIRVLIENGYDVREVLEDGSEIVLNFSNYDKDNTPVKEVEAPVVEEVKEEEEPVLEAPELEEVVAEPEAQKEEVKPEVKQPQNNQQPKQFKKKN